MTVLSIFRIGKYIPNPMVFLFGLNTLPFDEYGRVA